MSADDTSEGLTFEQVRHLENVNRLKAEFLANCSHELRTPIHAIIGYAELLLDSVYGPMTDEQEQTVRFIHESAQDLLDLVNNLLDLSRIESGRADLVLHSFDLRDLISELIGQLKPIADGKHVELTSSVLVNQPLIRTDRGKLKQILINLVGNAIKFTDRGGVTIAVSVVSQPGAGGRANPRFAIDVRDTGVGIPPDQLDRVFEKFYQVDGSAHRAHEGTGLGLYITKQLVDMLGGDIAIQSTPGQGTTATVSLPQNYEEIEGIHRLRSHIAAAGNTARGPDGDGQRVVLVVSERPDIARILADGLGSHEYDVRTAGDAERAVTLACKLQPLVILLDAQDSSSDLWSTFQELKIKPETKNIPTIFLSNSSAHGLGMPLAVAAPLSPRDVLRSVRAATSAGKKNILIVDDEESFRDVLKCALKDEGYHLAEATTGTEAIAKLEEGKPDLLLLDLNLPELDGWGVIRYITQQEKLKDMQVLVITGVMLDEHESATIQTHQYAFINKEDFKVNRVVKTVASLLDMR
ncbi:MAG TPA: hybrid sensor histidine kinase/response regulator [Verrucomicrobiae bacterium]|nr:hybrid sensor histidine kinase/response regulator [Verrucomicrobiae bacterium]